MTWFDRIQRWAAPPPTRDEQQKYQFALINSIILSLLLIMLLVLVITAFVATARIETIIIVSWTIILMLIGKFRLNRGNITGAKYIIPFILWLNSLLLVVFSGGTNNVSMIYFLVTGVFISLLFDWPGTWAGFGLTALTTFLIAIASTLGYLPNKVFLTPPLNGWLILSLGYLIVLVLIRLAIQSRDQALNSLRESENKYRTLFETVSTATIVVEKNNGVIQDVNSAAGKLYGYTPEEMIGMAVMELSAEPEKTLETIQGDTRHIPLRYHKRKDGSIFPVEIFDSEFIWADKELRSGNIHDIEERTRTEQRERAVSQRLAGIINAAQQLIQCKTLDEVYRMAVELGRNELGLERCAMYLFDPKGEILIGTYGTDENRQTTDERKIRMPIEDNEAIQQAQREQWGIYRGTLSHFENGAAIYRNEHWSVNTLIQSASGPIGVFFNDSAISNSAISRSQQEAVAVYCSLLGSIIEQKNTEIREHQLAAGLDAIIRAADELVLIDELDFLHRRAVELGRERLGLERCSLWLLDDDENFLQGTYGTDDHGNTISEKDVILEVAEYHKEHEFPHHWSVKLGDTHTYWLDGQTHFLEPGWIVNTAIRGTANKLYGIYSNDAALTQKPLDEMQQDILAVYCSLLGNIIERKRIENQQLVLSESLQAILNVADQLLTLNTLDEIYKHAVELGRQRLGLERCALFLLDEEQNILLGTYGTDEEGNTSDEREARVQIDDKAILSTDNGVWQIFRNKNSYYLRDKQMITKEHWYVSTLIRSIRRPLGVFFNDSLLSGAPINEAQQETVALYVSILGNIIERKMVETEREKLILELEGKNAELERFAYTVSHDLKAPLITIQGFMGYLEKDAVSGDMDRLHKDLLRISDATIRMQELLNDLLELSRIGRTLNPSKFLPFVWIVEEALRLVQGRLDQNQINVFVSEDLPFVYGDSARLVEVMQNLIDNAAKFVRSNSNPIIEIGIRDFDHEGFHTFYVKDNGIGIDPRFHERVFGLFDKLDLKTEGSGVGLALVKRIIELHNGRIWIESEGLDKGSTFYFTLPGHPPN